jgi:hypothetical protein
MGPRDVEPDLEDSLKTSHLLFFLRLYNAEHDDSTEYFLSQVIGTAWCGAIPGGFITES